jgi:hypothetical protein
LKFNRAKFTDRANRVKDRANVEPGAPEYARNARRAWLFAGSELAGQRAAIVMSLVQSARLNGHDPWAYLRDVLARLPTQLDSRIEELLPHRWQPSAAC